MSYLITVVVLGLVLIADCNITTSNTSRSINALFALLEYVEEACDSLEWCTVRKSLVIGQKAALSTCCINCSCEPSCFEERNCCPDWKLSSYFHGHVFENVSEFVYQISKDELAMAIDTSIVYSEFEKDDFNVATECLFSSVFRPNRHAPRSSMYRMVTHCSNLSAEENDNSKCEKSPGLSDQSHMDDFRPVQSLDTGIVYRNKYCFQCNQGSNNSSYEKWDVYIASMQSNSYLIFLNDLPFSYTDLIDNVASSRHAYPNVDILFEPSKELQRMHPSPHCVSVNIDACPVNDTRLQEATVNACNMYTLPVFTEINGTFTVLNNVACSRCLGFEFTKPQMKCSRYHSWWTRVPFLGKLSDQVLNVSFSLMDDEATQEAGHINHFSSVQCDKGFYFDDNKLICRQVYCPCGMMAYNSTCIPIYQDIPGRGFAVFSSAKLVGSFAFNNETVILAFEEKLINHFENEFTKLKDFHLVDIVLWKTEKSSLKPEFVVYIAFWPKQNSYLFIAKMISLIVRGIKHLEFNNASLTVKMDIKDPLLVYGNVIVDVVEKKKFLLARSSTGAYTSTTASDYITLSTCHFCYRVELFDDDYDFEPPFRFVMRQTRNVISNRAVTSILGKKRDLFCINDVFKQPPSVLEDTVAASCCGTWNNGMSEYEGGGKDDNTRRLTPLYHIAAIVAIITLVAIITRAVCTLRPTKQGHEDRSDTTEMTSVDNNML